MKEFEVIVPITGSYTVIVKAKNNKDAEDRAISMLCTCNIGLEDENGEDVIPEYTEIEPHEIIIQGNVFHGVKNRIESNEHEGW